MGFSTGPRIRPTKHTHPLGPEPASVAWDLPHALFRNWRHPATGYLFALVSQLIASLLNSLLLHTTTDFALLGLFHIVGIVIVSTVWSIGPGIFATVAGMVALSIYELATTKANIADIGFFLLIGGILTVLASRAEQERKKTENLARDLRAIEALTDTALTHLMLDNLFDELLQRVCAIMRVDNGALLLLDETQENLRIAAAFGPEASVAGKIVIPLGKGVAGTIASRRQPRIIDDLTRTDVFNSFLQQSMRSLIGVPLISGTRTLGVVHVDSVQTNRFNEHDLALLQRVADRMAIAIDNAQLYQAAHQSRLDAEYHAQNLDVTFDAMTDAVVMFDNEGHVTQMNKAARELYEHTLPQTMTDRPPHENVAAFRMNDEHGQPLSLDQWPTRRILRGESFQGSSSVDFQYTRMDGKTVFLSTSGGPVRNSMNEIIGGVTIYRDVTERRLLEKRTNDALEALLQMANLLIYAPVEEAHYAKQASNLMLNLTCRVLGCQRVAISVVDLETDLIRPLAVAGLDPEQERGWWAEQERQQVRMSDMSGQELFVRLLAGEILTIDMTQPPYNAQPNPYQIHDMMIAPIRFQQQFIGLLTLDYGGEAHTYTNDDLRLAGAVSQLMAFVIERERLVHERAAAEAHALALNEANQRMQEFLGIASHEIKTPITSIYTTVQLLHHRVKRSGGAMVGTSTDQALDLLIRTETQIKRLTRLLDDMLDISRIQSGKLNFHTRPCSLVTIVRDSVDEAQLVQPERLIDVVLPDEQDSEAEVDVDPDRIGQVIENFLTNALKYSEHDQPVTVTLDLAGSEGIVRVTDRGPGIPTFEQSRVWEMFHRVPGIEVRTGSGVGLGLGLHICKTIVERQGGKVGVESEPGAGSTFWFSLPLRHPAEAKNAAQAV